MRLKSTLRFNPCTIVYFLDMPEFLFFCRNSLAFCFLHILSIPKYVLISSYNSFEWWNKKRNAGISKINICFKKEKILFIFVDVF